MPADGCFPLAPSYDHVGPMAASVEGCVELMRALVPGFEPAVVDSLEELEVGIAWLDDADPLVRERVGEAAARFPAARPVDLPLPDPAENKLFMREVADVHRGLFPEYADDYGEGIRWKLELCAAGERRRGGDGRAAPSGVPGALRRGLRRARPPGHADDGRASPRPRTPTSASSAAAASRFTYPFDCLGWPALAIPCGPAEDGLPASVQLVGRPGDDARVLAVGSRLASPV